MKSKYLKLNYCKQRFVLISVVQLSIVLLTVVLLTTAVTVQPSYANEINNTVTLEGRTVILNNDGTWQYETTDRFANTKDGKRVRLKENGRWDPVGNTPLKTKDQVRTNELDIKLNKVVIETYKKKKQKNSSIKTQTVFYIDINNSPTSTKMLNIKDGDVSLIEVKDNNGKDYPVLSLKAVTEQQKPDFMTRLIVRAKKSPAIWDNVNSMSISFKKGFLELEEAITISEDVDNFKEKKVEGFE